MSTILRVSTYAESALVDQLPHKPWDTMTGFIRAPGAPEPLLTSLCISPREPTRYHLSKDEAHRLGRAVCSWPGVTPDIPSAHASRPCSVRQSQGPCGGRAVSPEDGWCGAPQISWHGWGLLLYMAGTPLLFLADASHSWWLGHLGFPTCPFKALEPL